MVESGRARETPAQPTSAGPTALRKAILDFLFPPRCVVCRARGEWLCPRCRPQLQLFAPPVCPRCGLPLESAYCPACAGMRLPVAALRTAGFFEGPLREAAHRLKFSGERYLAEPLGGLLAGAWRQAPLAGDVLVPVPLHPKDEATRGYNQATLLAESAGRQLGLPVSASGLQKVRETAPQVGLKREERLANLRGAFAWSGSTCPQRAILVDDVTTTGATLAACAAALRAAGATAVYALVLARAR